MAHCFFKEHFCYTLLLLLPLFLILFGIGFLVFGAFRLTIMSGNYDDTPQRCC